MEVGVDLGGEVVVDDDIDVGKVHATAHKVCGDKDTRLGLLEIVVRLGTLRLRHAGAGHNGGEVIGAEDAAELLGVAGGVDKDDDLIELDIVEEFCQTACLRIVIHFVKVLDDIVEREDAELVDNDLLRLSHEGAAQLTDALVDGRREHHHLLGLGGGHEDVLDVAAVLLEEDIALIDNKEADGVQVEHLAVDEGAETPGSANNDVGTLLHEGGDVLVLLGATAIESGDADVGEVFGETTELVGDLHGKLVSVDNDKRLDLLYIYYKNTLKGLSICEYMLK